MVKDFSVVYGSPWPPTTLASGFIQCGIFAHSSNGVPMHKIGRIVLECCAAEMRTVGKIHPIYMLKLKSLKI